MKNYIYLILLLVINANIYSNDSRTILGSSVEIIDNKNTNIIMREETINIKLFRDYYEVDVIFEFVNSGEAETILLGFPVEAVFMQDVVGEKEWAVVSDFRSYIDNEQVKEYTVREEIKYKDGADKYNPYTYITNTKWYIREVIFPANSKTISRVIYKAPYGHRGFSKNIGGYIFGTGYNWKGPIVKMIINISHSDDTYIDYFDIGKFDKNKILNSFTWEGDGMYRFEFDSIEPNVTDKIELYIRECDMLNANYCDFNDDWDGWVWDERLLYNNVSDIKLYTKNQLRLFINFFYAKHGYSFKNELYKTFFHRLHYKVNNNFSENNFNEIERKNIDYLSRLEKMIP